MNETMNGLYSGTKMPGFNQPHQSMSISIHHRKFLNLTTAQLSFFPPVAIVVIGLTRQTSHHDHITLKEYSASRTCILEVSAISALLDTSVCCEPTNEKLKRQPINANGIWKKKRKLDRSRPFLKRRNAWLLSYSHETASLNLLYCNCKEVKVLNNELFVNVS